MATSTESAESTDSVTPATSKSTDADDSWRSRRIAVTDGTAIAAREIELIKSSLENRIAQGLLLGLVDLEMPLKGINQAQALRLNATKDLGVLGSNRQKRQVHVDANI